MRRGVQDKKEKRRLPAVVWIVVALGVLLPCTGMMLAKYRTEQIRQAEMISAGFHISSDYLKETNVSYPITNTTEPISIALYNYETENVSLISEVPISYTVTVNGGTCMNPADGKGTLPGDKANPSPESNTLNIQPDAAAQTVKVTVTTEPFAYTLQAEFVLPEAANKELQVKRITNNGDYYLVTVHTGQESGEKTLTWPSGLLPDNTNEQMKDWTGASGTFTAEPYHTYELIFFNPNSASHADNEFQIN